MASKMSRYFFSFLMFHQWHKSEWISLTISLHITSSHGSMSCENEIVATKSKYFIQDFLGQLFRTSGSSCGLELVPLAFWFPRPCMSFPCQLFEGSLRVLRTNFLVRDWEWRWESPDGENGVSHSVIRLESTLYIICIPYFVLGVVPSASSSYQLCDVPISSSLLLPQTESNSYRGTI